jgi:hypothetical protein
MDIIISTNQDSSDIPLSCLLAGRGKGAENFRPTLRDPKLSYQYFRLTIRLRFLQEPHLPCFGKTNKLINIVSILSLFTLVGRHLNKCAVLSGTCFSVFIKISHRRLKKSGCCLFHVLSPVFSGGSEETHENLVRSFGLLRDSNTCVSVALLLRPHAQ